MKHLPLLLLSLLIYNSTFSQDKEVNNSNEGADSSVKIELITEADTLSTDRPYPLYLEITNVSRKPIYVPKALDVRSRIFPNGVGEVWDGAGVYLHLEPLPAWASIHQENLSLIEPVPFIMIKPKASVKLWLTDLSRHIQLFNENIDTEDLQVKSGRDYKLSVIYSNSRKKKGKEQKSFIGEVKSEEKTLYIKK